MAGRTPYKPAAIIETEFDTPHAQGAVMKIVKEANAADTQQDSAVRAVAAKVGYQLPADCTDPDLIQRDIAANMRRSVEACLEVGRGLAVLKQACGHGNFVARLEVLQIEASVAQRFMQAAMKFSKAATSQHLTKAIGTKSKLFELLILDDEQIEELELTGQTGELKLDDVATMSVKELRAALREARGNAEVKDRRVSEQYEQIDKLKDQIDRLTHGKPDEKKSAELAREARASAALQEAALEMLGVIQRFDQALTEVLAIRSKASKELADSTTQWLFQRIADIAADRDMTVDFQSVVIPKWVADLDAAMGK